MKKILFASFVLMLCTLVSPKAHAQQTMNYIPGTATCWTGTLYNGWLDVNLFAKWGYGNNCVNQQSGSWGRSANTTDVSCDNRSDPPVAQHEYQLRIGCYCLNWHYVHTSITANSDCTGGTNGFFSYSTCG